MMASEPATETATATKLKLDPPEALQPMTTAEASGLVPLKTEEVSELDRKVAQFVDELAARPERLAFDPRQFEPRDIDEPVAAEAERPPVRIGVVPGPEDGRPGVPVDALVEGSPGELAGIRAGDRIVRVGARRVESVYDYVRARAEVPVEGRGG